MYPNSPVSLPVIHQRPLISLFRMHKCINAQVCLPDALVIVYHVFGVLYTYIFEDITIKKEKSVAPWRQICYNE